MQDTRESEVARLLTQINSEYEAARLGLSGLSQGSSQHEFITKRMERMAELHFELRDLVGDEAMKQLELDGDQGQEPELAVELRKTVHFAIDPQFKEQLHTRLL